VLYVVLHVSSVKCFKSVTWCCGVSDDDSADDDDVLDIFTIMIGKPTHDSKV